MSKPPSAATIYDVARLAGVSPATVSYVLHGRRGGKSRISDATRQRVLAALTELNYFPNDTARSLRRRRTDRICLVISRLGSPYADAIAADVQRVAATHGYSVVITVGGQERTEHIVSQLQRRLADGAIIDDASFTAEMFAALVRSNLAVVALANDVEPHGFDVVRTTERESSYEAVAYLVGRGHRRIALLQHGAEVQTSGIRFASYRQALHDNGLAIDPALIRPGAESRETAFASTRALLMLPQRPTAIFSESDIGAISALWAIRDLGLRAPADVAVIGVGNSAEGCITRPALTTVGPQALDFAPVADLLFSRLTGQATDDRVVVQPWSLVCRQSA